MINPDFQEVVRRIVESCAEERGIRIEGGGPYAAAFNSVIAKAHKEYPNACVRDR